MYAFVEDDNSFYNESELCFFNIKYDIDDISKTLDNKTSGNIRNKFIREYVSKNNMIKLESSYLMNYTYYYKYETDDVYKILNDLSLSSSFVYNNYKDIQSEFIKANNEPNIRKINNLPTNNLQMGEKEVARNKIIDDYVAENNLTELKGTEYGFPGTIYFYNKEKNIVYEVMERNKLLSFGLCEEGYEPEETIPMIFENLFLDHYIREINNLPPKTYQTSNQT